MKFARYGLPTIALCCALGGAFWWMKSKRRDSTDQLPTATVSPRDLSSTLTATGIVQAMVGAEVKVGARVSGRVEKLYANVGDTVRAGQLIALLDDRELKAQVAAARAELAAAEARAAEAATAAVAQPARNAAALSEADAVIAAAKSQLHQAEEAARSQPVVTASQVEQAQSALTAARARLAQAKASAAAEPKTVEAGVKQAESTLHAAEAALVRVRRGARKEEIAEAEAVVRQTEAALTEAAANLRRAENLFAQDFVAGQEVDRRRAERDTAQAKVDAARQKLNLLRTQTLPEDLSKAEAEVARAKASLAEAKTTAVRVEVRRREVAAAEAEVTRAEAALRAAEAARSEDEIKRQQADAARAQTEQAAAARRRTQVDTVDTELKRRAAEAARQQVQQARAAVRAAEAKLSYTRLVAPLSGVIASVATQEGETVAAGLQAPTFVTIIDLNRLEVDAYVDETDIGQVKVGQSASFTVDAYPNRDFSGRVSAVYPKAHIEQGVVEYDTVITIADADGLLKPDMTANVTILASQHPHVLCVPHKSIHRFRGQKVVFVLASGQPSARPVVTGVRDRNYTEIVRGVKEGERVLLEVPPEILTNTKGIATDHPPK